MTRYIAMKERKNRQVKYMKDKNVLDYVVTTAIDSADFNAITYDNITITYTEFLKKCCSAAMQLKQCGVKKGDRIAFYIESSDRLVILVIASLMIGACYIPIDKQYPEDRVNYILHDSKPSLIIVDSNINEIFIANNYSQIVSIDSFIFSDNFPKNDIYNYKHEDIKGSDLAYIIYTSGSTGNPKGIKISHSSINNHMIWMFNEFEFDSQDKFLLKTPISFDASVWEMLLPFYIGSELVVLGSQKCSNINYMYDCIMHNKITVIQLVPSLLHTLLNQAKTDELKSLRFIFSGGESLPTSTKKLFFKTLTTCELVNLYGPAEATIDTTFYFVKNKKNKISKDIIGKPIQNVKTYVINSNNKLCQTNEVGELLIGGAGLALGYLNIEGNSSRSFIYNKQIADGLLYKTGDLVKWNEDSELEYCGRSDNQIKINGVRVELEEIRSHLLSLDGVYDCVFDKKINENSQSSTLICYVITGKDKKINPSFIKNMLSTKLPAYMIPGIVHIVNDPQLTCNGKIDLNFIKSQSTKSYSIQENLSETESAVLSLWNSVLVELIYDVNLNFFDAGGDSIKASILAHLIGEKFSLEINIADLAIYDTVAKQANYINTLMNSTNDNLDIKSLNSPAQTKLFLIHPIGGTVFWYLPLANDLDKKVQVYGISDPGLTNKSQPFDTLEQLAKYYTSLIQKIQPGGTYWIGGASFGATVAIEVAKQLTLSGFKVHPIQVFDGWAIYPKKLQEKAFFENLMLHQQNEWVTKFNQTNVDQSCYQNLLDLQMKRLKMLFNYRPYKFDFPIKLYKASEILPIFKIVDCINNHWHKYTSNLERTLVPGNHETMFQKENVKILSNSVLSSIE